MTLFLVILGFGLGLVCIITGGDILVRSAIKLNRISGINSVIIGATFVSVATTLPEAFISVFAVTAGNHGIAVGNAIGAMIANVALVLAVSLVFIPNIVKRGDVFLKTLFMMGILVIVFLFGMDLKISWYEGTILIVAFVLFLLLNICDARKSGDRGEMTPLQRHCEGKKIAWGKIALGFVFGQALLCVGAFALVENGERLAHIWGISETVIGFTIIAVGTSLPELVTAIVSIRGKCGGLAIGNVIGANIINCTLLLGICGVIGGIKGANLPISKETAFVALPVLILMSVVAILPILFRGRAHRAQGVCLLTLYAAYVAYLFIVQPL
jgi:cation:H+ antiporter